MNFNDKIKDNNIKISVVGLGYVGLPLAVEFAKCTDVIGFDINEKKVEAYKSGIDVTQEVGDFEVKNTDVNFTSDESKLKEAKFHIVAVPTPINTDKTPNLQPVISATETVGRNLTKGSIVVYESTVYPGTTEEVCIPILEETSGLKYMEDFKVGYSPERINPGDKINRLTSIVKVVSGCDAETLEIIADTYQMIIEAGVYKAESIKVAEAAKVIENSQRDINIAFMNELAMVFDKMDIDTHAVLRAASTKWNFLNFTPGLVGGHCIGVDPYYFIYKAEELGYHSQVISAGRKINDGMAKFVSDNVVKSLIKADKKVKGSKVAVFGLTFKENCPDTRNTKVVDIIKELREYEVDILVHDPIADAEEASDFYGIDLSSIEDIQDVDAVVFAVAHDEFDKFDLKKIGSMFKQGTKVLIDIKGLFDKEEVLGEEFVYWRL